MKRKTAEPVTAIVPRLLTVTQAATWDAGSLPFWTIALGPWDAVVQQEGRLPALYQFP